jgi:hypothetical protein
MTFSLMGRLGKAPIEGYGADGAVM